MLQDGTFEDLETGANTVFDYKKIESSTEEAPKELMTLSDWNNVGLYMGYRYALCIRESGCN